MSRISIDNLSYKQLLALQRDIEDAIIARKAEDVKTMKAKLSDLAEQSGFSVEELFGKARKNTGKVAVKFRNPKNGNETWAGRGRQPLWLVAALKKGAKLESFAV